MKEWDIALAELEGEPSADTRDEGCLSLEEAFAEHHQLVYRYACALTRDRALSEDAAQEVFLRLHRRRIAAGILGPWLIRVTANVVRNLLRTRGRAVLRDTAFAADALHRQEHRLPDERAIEALGQLYDSTRDEETRREILEALSEADGAVALQRIISAARADPSMNVRRHAIELLGESDDPAALTFLEGLLR